MKKLLCVILTSAAMLFASAAVFADYSEWNDDDIMPLLKSLGIMEGDDNGDYMLDNYVTRQEMAKIAVNSSSFKDETAVGMRVSPFKDINSYDWAAPYILNGTRNGLFNGYLDGSFHPTDMVTYEEAITMMLKVLGYTDSMFGVSYPYGQVNLAKNLDLTDNMNSDYECWLTRRQVARLVYNSLDTEMVKGGDSNTASSASSTGAKLISMFDANVVEDAIILSNDNGKLQTSSGKYNAFDGFNYDYIGMQGDMVVKNNKDILCFIPQNSEFDKYVVYSVLDNTIVGYHDGIMEQITLKDSTTCYKNSAAQTYAAIKSGMEMGDVLKVQYDNNGAVDYAIYETGSLEGPTRVITTEMISMYANASTQVMRDGNKTSTSAIQLNDVMYYSPDLDMIFAYSTKVTGIYENASPSKDNPTTVKISGTEYSVEGVEAFNALSSSGTLKYGDTITAILGKNGKSIAGVVTSTSITADTTTRYGYLVSTGKKNFTNNDGTSYSSYYVNLVGTDGNSYEYTTSKDYSNYVSCVVKASFSNGTTTVTKVNGGGISGKVDADNQKIGSYKIANECKILDTVGYYSTGAPLYKSVYLQRLNGSTIESSNVKYYAMNSLSEVTELILNNATGDSYMYGIVSSVSTSEGSNIKTTKIDIDGTTYTSTTNGIAAAHEPCQAYMENGSIQFKRTLDNYGSRISKLTQSTATINNVEYKLSDKVVVYTKSLDYKFSIISINDAINGDYNLTAYYDKEESSGGRIRVIIATQK